MMNERARRLPTWLFHPLAQFALVVAACLVNQVLCDAYILRVHHGDPSFAAQYVGPGWFVLASGHPVVRFMASHAGDGTLLAPSLFRVQAFLELPFVLFAYLTVARALDRGAYRLCTRFSLLFVTSVAFSVTFSLIEVALRNPWTNDDLVLRTISCLVTPVYVAWTAQRLRAREGAEAARPTGVLGMLSFVAVAASTAYVVLASYDALLLYNLGHLDEYLPGIPMALGVAAVASFAAPRVDGAVFGAGPAAPSIAVVQGALAAFTVAFFFPSLSLRYFGWNPAGAAIGLLIIAGSLGYGLVRAKPGALGILRLVAASVPALGAGAWAAREALATAGRHAIYELCLARASIAFLVASIVVVRVTELVLGGVAPSMLGAHEAKAPVDQA